MIYPCHYLAQPVQFRRVTDVNLPAANPYGSPAWARQTSIQLNQQQNLPTKLKIKSKPNNKRTKENQHGQ